MRGCFIHSETVRGLVGSLAQPESNRLVVESNSATSNSVSGARRRPNGCRTSRGEESFIFDFRLK